MKFNKIKTNLFRLFFKFIYYFVDFFVAIGEIVEELENWFNKYLKNNVTLLTTLGIFATILALLYQIQSHDKNQTLLLIGLKTSFIGLLILNIMVLTVDIIRGMKTDIFLSSIYLIKIIFITLWHTIALSFIYLNLLDIRYFIGKSSSKINPMNILYIQLIIILIFNILLIEINRKIYSKFKKLNV